MSGLGDGSGQQAAQTLPSPTLFRLATAGAAGLSFGWAPLAVTVQIDALRSTLTWAEVGLMLGRVQGLLVGAACCLALLGFVVAKLFRRNPGLATSLAWLTVLVPVVALCVGQFVYTLTLWVSSLVGSRSLVSGPWVRWLPALGLVLALAWSVKRQGWHALAQGLAGPLRPLHWPVLALTVLCALLCWPRGNDPQGPAAMPTTGPARPSVLLLSIDTLAYADANLCSEAGGAKVMPHLQALAAQSTCFRRAYANANATVSATASIATGVLPWNHQAYQLIDAISGPLAHETLAAHFQRHGWRTLSVTDTLGASPYQHGSWRDFDRIELVPGNLTSRLDHWSASAVKTSSVTVMWPLFRLMINPLERWFHGEHAGFDSERLVDQFLDAWGATRADDRPVFAWFHSWMPHAPYLPPASTRFSLLPAGELEHINDFLPGHLNYTADQQPEVDKHRLRYRESIMALDLALGRLLQSLKAKGQFDDLLILVVADHGESFENGLLGHAKLRLDEAVARIPLLVKMPGQKTGQVVDDLVSQVDIAPTLLEAVGLDVSLLQGRDGHSLVPLLKGQPMPPRAAYTMAMPANSRFRPLPHLGHFAVVDDGWKYMLEQPSGAAALFDLRKDPGAVHNVLAEHPDVARALDVQLRAQLDRAEQRRKSQHGG